MRYSILVVVFLFTTTIFSVFGCENNDLGSGDAAQFFSVKEKDIQKAQDKTQCGFDPSPITVGQTCRVTIENNDLKDDKDFLVEVTLGGKTQSPAGEFEKKGTMLVDLEPTDAGQGTISVFEVKVKKGKEERKLKAFCTFDVEAGEIEVGDDEVGDGEAGDDETVDTEIVDTEIVDTEIDDVEDGDEDGASPADLCPEDPNKTDPGECGCGIPDSDADGDGTLDCVDDCPLDADKTDTGECGCGVQEGTCGTNEDLCPDDPNKTEPGECGCGVQEGTCTSDEYKNERWCIGEDTDEPPEEEKLPVCNICGKRELNTKYWENNGPCLQAWSEVAWLSSDDPECVEATAQWEDVCCEGYFETEVRKQCTRAMGPYEPVDLCDDGCFPSNPSTIGVYSLLAGGSLAPWVNDLGDRTGTCYEDDGASKDALVWSCRRVYYLLKYGHIPSRQAMELITFWGGHNQISAQCGCDEDNTNNPTNQ